MSYTQSVKKHVWVFIILCILGYISYNNSFTNEFNFEDQESIIDFKRIHSFDNLNQVFSPQFTSESLHYRPLYQLSNMILYHLFEDDAVGYRMVGTTYFIIFCWFLYCFLYTLTKREEIAFLTSSLFCVHPIHAIVINYVTSHAIILSGIFVMLSLTLALKYIKETKSAITLITSLLCYVVSLLICEQAILTPLFLIVVLATNLKFNIRQSLQASLPFLFLSFLSYLFMFTRNQMINSASNSILNLMKHANDLSHLILWYLKKLIYPEDVVLIFSKRPEMTVSVASIGLLLLISAGLYFLFIRKQSNAINCAALLWFGIGFLPFGLTAFIRKDLGLVIEPHWFFLSSIGFFLFLSNILMSLSIEKVRKYKLAILCILLISYITTTRAYNTLWRTNESFVKHWLQVNPENDFARSHVVSVDVSKGDIVNALSGLTKLSENPYYRSNANYLFGVIYGKSGNHELARRYFQLAVDQLQMKHAMPPNLQASLYTNLGVSYANEGFLGNAKLEFKKALNIDPFNEDAIYLLNMMP